MTVSVALVFAAQVSNLDRVLIPLTSVSPVESSGDFRPLGKLIANAQVVGAGEATHGSKEFFQLKHRLFRYLVEEKGFTILALEASMAKCMALDRFVLTGEGDAVVALREQGFWTWSTAEVLNLILWMRAYNADPKHIHKLRVVGVDMQSRYEVQDTISNIARSLGVKEDYVTDPVWYPMVRYHMGEEVAMVKFHHRVARLVNVADAAGQPELSRFILGLWTNFEQATQLEGDAVFVDDFIDVREEGVAALPLFRSNLEVLRTLVKADADLQYVFDRLLDGGRDGLDSVRFGRGTAALAKMMEVDNAHRESLVAMAKIAKLMVQGLRLSEMQKHSRRDQYMAQNVQWVVTSYLPGSKAMFWGHNWHVMSRPAGEPEACGGELRRLMPGKYFSVGFAFGSGGFRANDTALEPGSGPVDHEVSVEGQGTLDKFLGSVNRDMYFVSPGQVKELGGSFTTRTFGSRFDKSKPGSYVGSVVPDNAYDGMIFVRKVTAAKGL